MILHKIAPPDDIRWGNFIQTDMTVMQAAATATLLVLPEG
ncbi:MAG: hypothetical protein ACJAZ9_001225 [Neolewinella sp.]